MNLDLYLDYNNLLNIQTAQNCVAVNNSSVISGDKKMRILLFTFV